MMEVHGKEEVEVCDVGDGMGGWNSRQRVEVGCWCCAGDGSRGLVVGDVLWWEGGNMNGRCGCVM